MTNNLSVVILPVNLPRGRHQLEYLDVLLVLGDGLDHEAAAQGLLHRQLALHGLAPHDPAHGEKEGVTGLSTILDLLSIKF